MSWLWAWMIDAPASTQRRTSSPIWAGVNGTCGLRAGLVMPLMAASMITGVSLIAVPLPYARKTKANSRPAHMGRRCIGHEHSGRPRRERLLHSVMAPPLGDQHEQRPPVGTAEHGREQVAFERHSIEHLSPLLDPDALPGGRQVRP